LQQTRIGAQIERPHADAFAEQAPHDPRPQKTAPSRHQYAHRLFSVSAEIFCIFAFVE
jgi:hypothetical protein